MASRHWVGGTNVWDGTTTANWSATNGGASGASVPTANDDVFFDSGSGAVTVTLTSSSVCQSVTCTGFTGGTISHPAAITWNIGGSSAGPSNVALLFISGMSYTLGNASSSAIAFISTSTTQQTITTGGKTLGNVTYNGSGGSWILEDTNTMSNVTLTNGTLNTNNQTGAWGSFSTGSGTKTLTPGSSSITITVAGAQFVTSASGLTITPNTATFTFTASSADVTLGNYTWAGTSFVFSQVDTITLRSNFTCANITITGDAIKTSSVSVTGNFTCTGVFTVNGNSVTNREFIQSNTLGTTQTITAAAVSLSNVDFMDITGAGAATWSGTSLGDCQGNSGITFTTAATQTWQGTSGGNWSTAANWTSRVPLPQDNVIISSAFIASQTITMDMFRLGKTINFTGTTGNPQLSVSTNNTSIFGSFILAAGMTMQNQNKGIQYLGRGSYVLTTNGVGYQWGTLNFVAPGGTYTLGSNLDGHLGNTLLYIGAGCSFSDGGYTVSVLDFGSSDGTAGKTVTISNTWTLSQTGPSNIWNSDTQTTYVINSSAAIVITNSTNTVQTFIGAGQSYPSVTWESTGYCNFTITGNNTFASLNLSCATASTVTLPANGTQLITNTLLLEGASGQNLSVVSATTGSPTTLYVGNATVGSGTYTSNAYISLSADIALAQFPNIAYANVITDAIRNAGIIGDGLIAPAGINISHGATNLCSAAGTGTSFGSSTVTLVTPTVFPNGAQAYSTAVTANNSGLYFPATYVNGDTYTLSGWVNAPVGDTFKFATSSQSSSTFTGTGSPQRFSWTVTVTTDNRFYVVSVGGSSFTMVIEAGQAELGSIATSFCGYSTSRGAGRIQMPAAPISSVQGAIAVGIRTGFPSSAVPGAGNVMFWEWGPTSTPNFMGLYMNTGGTWGGQIADSTGDNETHVSDSFSTNAIRVAIFAWTSTHIMLSVDGSSFTSVARTKNPTGLPFWMDFGSDAASGSYPNWTWYCDSQILWAVSFGGTPTNTDSTTMNGWGATAPTIAQVGALSAASNPTALAKMVDGTVNLITTFPAFTFSGQSTIAATFTEYQNITLGVSGKSTISSPLVEYQEFAATVRGQSSIFSALTELDYFPLAVRGQSSIAQTFTEYQRFAFEVLGQSTITNSLEEYQRFSFGVSGSSSIVSIISRYAYRIGLNKVGLLTEAVGLPTYVPENSVISNRLTSAKG